MDAAAAGGAGQEQSARPWPYLLVATSPPGMGVRGGHTACSVREQVLVELHSLVAHKPTGSEIKAPRLPQALPVPHAGPPHLAGHVVADGHDGCVAQLQDAKHLAAHDGQCSPGHEGHPLQHALQEALGHYQ